ncbi:MAG: hypothetical protein RL641_157 [Candidatus Parcubacteria bacterium]
MDDIMKPLGTFFGYFFNMVLLIVLALVYLPSFLITTHLNKPFEDLLKEFGF